MEVKIPKSVKKKPDISINQQFKNRINDKLSTSGFSSEDFEVNVDNSSTEKIDTTDNIIIDIRYLYNDSHYFSSTFSTAVTNKDMADMYSIMYSPGTYLTKESKVTHSIAEFFHIIGDWVQLLRLELKASPIGRQLAENEEKIQEIQDIIEEKFKEDTNVFFSKQEGNELKDKLDELEKLFKEKIGSIEKDESSLEKESEKLHEEVDMLKEQVDYLPKKKWATALAVKFLNWTSRNPAAAKQIGQAGLKLVLPQEVEESISLLLPESEPQNKK
ncbi:hypothetical protein [Peribacillus butanolivorans]|uniref:hypothetical protein n=1 Tax=Peribacillus butanolivorans TaxID=421767 RepID=UPI00367339A5